MHGRGGGGGVAPERSHLHVCGQLCADYIVLS